MKKVTELTEALDRIAFPIKHLQQDAEKDGCKIDGGAAVSLSNNASWLRSIAEKALADTPTEVGSISDGYHTFDELYEHRIVNYIALCLALTRAGHYTWRSEKHSDGSSFDGWFVLGINSAPGKQITYHLPMSKWGDCNFVPDTLLKAPEFDGHTSEDVLARIRAL